MKKIKDLHKYIIGIIIGIIIIGSLSVYAIDAVIDSREVSYDNKTSKGNYDNVQESIDELYRRSGILDKEWKDPILNGADPVLGEDMIPVTIDDDGTVHYANLYTKWYEYETKRWANAVILTDDGKNKNYKTGDKIDEEYIESYFVWIPRYKYKIWNLATEGGCVDLNQVKNLSVERVREVTGNARLIDIIFEDKNTEPSTSETLNSYYTHPAFTAFGVNGLWIAKFEASGTTSAITVKPNMTSLMNQNVGKFWNAFYDYRRNLDSHMIKNTEWGAVAYLSHSVYGIGTEININNNSEYRTGFSASTNTDQSSAPGTCGTGTGVTQPWNTSTGYLASTTSNITGVYDMRGGAYEYMAAYIEGKPGNSGFTSELTDVNYTKYFDKYSASSNTTSYNFRILGDATGEMGPFYYYLDKDKNARFHNAWYADDSHFVDSTVPWFHRGGGYSSGAPAGQFTFARYTGDASGDLGSRLVLAVK